MELSWFENILYGFVMGVTEIIPVSSQAHRILLLKLFGVNDDSPLLRMLVHIAALVAVYICCQTQIVKILRARKMSRIPKQKRRRPLDVKSLMDLRLWQTMIIPVILGFFIYEKVQPIGNNLLVLAVLLFINGLILYIPQYLTSSNKDSRTMSRVEGLLMGLGGSLSVFPGISGVGASLSIGSICGVERSYTLNMTLLMSLVSLLGFIVFDVMAIVSIGLSGLSFTVLLGYLLSAAGAFVSVMIGIRFMRGLAANTGFNIFACYCWGLALFTFIMNLMS